MNFTVYEMSSGKKIIIVILCLTLALSIFGGNLPVHAKSSVNQNTEEKIRNFLEHFHVDLSRKNPEAIAKYYASKVNWFNKPNFPRSRIIKEQRAIKRKFYRQNYQLQWNMEITPLSTFPLRYKVTFSSRYKTLSFNGKKCGHWNGNVIIELLSPRIINYQQTLDMKIISQSGYDLNLSCEKADEAQRNSRAKPIPQYLACAVLLKNFRNEGCDIYVDFGCEKTCRMITSNNYCARNSSIRQVCWPYRVKSFQEKYGGYGR